MNKKQEKLKQCLKKLIDEIVKKEEIEILELNMRNCVIENPCIETQFIKVEKTGHISITIELFHNKN